MKERKMIVTYRPDILRLEHFNNKSLDEVIEIFTTLKNKYKNDDDYIKTFEFDEDDYDALRIVTHREETDEEFNDRIRHEEKVTRFKNKRKQLETEKEIKTLKRLTKKYLKVDLQL